MTKDTWNMMVRKTAWASKKRKLGKRELFDLQNAQIALNSLKPKSDNFIEKDDPKSIGDILNAFRQRKL